MAHAAIRRTNSERGGSREVRAKPPHPRRVFMQQRPQLGSGREDHLRQLTCIGRPRRAPAADGDAVAVVERFRNQDIAQRVVPRRERREHRAGGGLGDPGRHPLRDRWGDTPGAAPCWRSACSYGRAGCVWFAAAVRHLCRRSESRPCEGIATPTSGQTSAGSPYLLAVFDKQPPDRPWHHHPADRAVRVCGFVVVWPSRAGRLRAQAATHEAAQELWEYGHAHRGYRSAPNWRRGRSLYAASREHR